MEPVTIAAAAAGAISAIAGLFSKHHDRKQSVKDQKQLMSYQNDLAIQNWNMENDYNTPVNQQQRLMQAGYNPALSSPDGTPMQMQSVSLGNSSSPAEGTSNLLRSLEIANGIINQSRLTKSQIELNKAQEEKLGADTSKTNSENEQIKQFISTYSEKFAVEMSKLRSETVLNDAQRNKAIEEVNVLRSESALKDAQKDSVLQDIQNNKKLTDAKVKELSASTAAYGSTVLLNRALLNKANMESALLKVQTEYQQKATPEMLTKVANEAQNVIKEGDKILEETHSIKAATEKMRRETYNANLPDFERVLLNGMFDAMSTVIGNMTK